MYYIIEKNYVGPNKSEDPYFDADRIEIRTSPATTNRSREVRTEGWCGTTNDWATDAHGEYATIEEARAAITEIFGEVRDSDDTGEKFESYEEDVIEIYKQGKFTPLSSRTTADFTYGGIKNDIEADTTDERIAELVAKYEAEANSMGYTLHSDLEACMQEHRQYLRDEMEEDED